jgi:uncharacterized protein (TIGR04141 family)
LTNLSSSVKPSFSGPTFYLLEKGFTINEAVKYDQIKESIPLQISSFHGVLFIGETERARSEEYGIYGQYAFIEPENFEYDPRPPIVFIFEYKNNYYAIAHGNGRFLIKPDLIIPNFGLKTILNIAKHDDIKELNSTTLERNKVRRNERVSEKSSVWKFEFNYYLDLLNGMAAEIGTSQFGLLKVNGRTSLNWNRTFLADELDKQVAFIHESFYSNSYKENFEWYDYIKSVSNKETVDLLNLYLIQELNSIREKRERGQYNSNTEDRTIFLNAPEYIDPSSFMGFQYGSSNKDFKNLKSDLSIELLLDRFYNKDLASVKKLRDFKITCYYDGRVKHASWPVLNCIDFIYQDGDQTYVLFNGKWFEVVSRYYDEVNNAFETISVQSHESIGLPVCKASTEGQYNKYASNKSSYKFHSLDTESIGSCFEGYDKLEPCDLWGRDGSLVFVKTGSKSATLNHLWEQGMGAAFSLCNDEKYRRELCKRIPDYYKNQLTGDKPPKPNQVKVIFALIQNAHWNKLHISFLAKLALHRVHKKLRGEGFKVILTKIPRVEIPPTRETSKSSSGVHKNRYTHKRKRT